jgi:hypothetical protein
VRQALVPMGRCRNSLIGTAEQGTAKIQTTPRWQTHPSFATQSSQKRTLLAESWMSAKCQWETSMLS